jgi:DNA mismatch endonuclease (patch repair protein)
MPDVVTPETRSRMMAGIRGRDTQPEMVLRRGLHRAGFRFRLHDRRLSGKPDLVFPGRSAVIFVHGCFWHGHDCHLFKWPSSRPDWWRAKIDSNKARDATQLAALHGDGWRVLTVWECALKGRTRLPDGEALTCAAEWLQAGQGDLVLRGRA